MAKVGVILSGCGVFDGSEVTETVLTLLYLEKAGAEITLMAPDVEQMHVINHLKGEPAEGESRNVLVESARIARGDIQNTKDISIADFDALMIPGGFGAAKNLSTFAVDGADCTVNPDVDRLIKETVQAKKPLAAVCIAPVLVAKALEGTGVKTSLTIGNNEDVSSALEAMGANHVNCPVKEAMVDRENKIITSPAYMYDASVAEVAEGIESTVKELMKMM